MTISILENKMMNNRSYRRLLEEKNKLVKRLNFAEQRLEKYDYALSDLDIAMLQQRIADTMMRLADVNDKLADLEDGVTSGVDEAAAAAIPQKWVGNASKALKDASHAASR